MPEVLELLVVEDNLQDVILVEEYLYGAAVRMDSARSLATALDALSRKSYDLVLLDLGLPDSRGTDTYSRLAAAEPDVPVIVLTGHDDDATAVHAVRLGAQDYLVKDDVSGPLLKRAVRYSAERAAARRRLEHVNRVLRAVRDTNRLVVEVRDREVLSDRACDLLVETRGYVGAWIQLSATADAPAYLAHRAAPGVACAPLPSGGLLDLPCARAALESPEQLQAYSCRDFCEQCQWCRLPAAPDAERLVAGIRRGTRSFGALWVALAPRDEASSEETSLLGEIASDLAFALHDIDSEQARLQAEETLEQREGELSLVYDHAPVLLLLVDSQLRVRKLNRMARESGGFASTEEALGRPCTEVLGCVECSGPEAAHAVVQQILRTTLHDGRRAVQQEVEVRPGRAGEARWLSISTAPLTLDGEPMVLLTAQDVTERRTVERAHLVSEQRFRQFFESAPEYSFIVGPGGGIERANEAALRGLGFTAESLQKRTLASLLAPESATVLGEKWGEGAASTLENEEAEIVAADGGHRRVLLSVSPLGGPSDDGGSQVAVLRDITALRSLQSQLLQAQKMAAIGRLAGGVAHDFNNLLMVILNSAEMVVEELAPSSPLRPDLDEITRSARRAEALTRQLLAFSRKQLIRPEARNLDDLLGGLSKMLHRLIGEDVDLRTVLDGDLLPARVDAGQFEQVVLNLVVNARDAMPGGGRLEIRTRNVQLESPLETIDDALPAGDYVCVTIGDSGSGIAPADLPHIFEPFFSTKEVGRGTGLGLSMVYGIIRQHGGGVCVRSDPGRGTTFELFWPALQRNAPISTPILPAAGAMPRGRGELVLVVEDDHAVRRSVTRVLSQLGYELLEAASPAEAESVAARAPRRLDLLVTDVVMPAASGPELARSLVATNPNLRVLFMSGYSDALVAQHGVASPGIAARVLPKPFSGRTLAQAVRRLLDAAPDAS